MKQTLLALILAVACCALAAPAFAGCPVADQKVSNSSYKSAKKAVDALTEEGGTGGTTVEITEPGTAVTATPGAPPSEPGPPDSDDKAVLDALTLDKDAAKAAMP